MQGIKQNGRGTANLRSHLLFHGLKDYAFQSQQDQRISSKVTTSVAPLPLARKREIDDALIRCIVQASLPYQLFNQSALIQFLQTLVPGYKPPDRHTISHYVVDQYYEHVHDLKSLLPHLGPLAFTSDMWTDVSSNQIISLSIHTFSIDFELVSLPISFHRFSDQKLAKNIRAFFEHERERFGIRAEQLAGITTDNGPDIRSAAASYILGPRYACLAHCLNLVVYHGVCFWKMPNPNK